MNTPKPASSGGSDRVTNAALKHKRRFSLIWLIPIVAAVAGIWLIYTTYAERGPLITITFPTASGIEPGKTAIKYRDVQLGVVQTVTLSDDLTHVVVTARMDKTAASELRTGTMFWIESARITAAGVAGLGTLLSGVYIGMRPGDGDETRHFDGLENPPLYQVNIPGKNFTLKAAKLGSVSQGSPIFFRGIQVGGVLGYRLENDGSSVTIYAFIRSPYDQLVHEGSDFWNASGIDVSLNASGVSVRTESLESVLIGGVAFDTREEETASPAAQDGAEFRLFASYADIAQAKYTIKIPFAMYFDGSVAGLEPGAPVLCLGMRVGEVTDLRLEVDPKTTTIRIPVTFVLEPQRWMPSQAAEAVSPEMLRERMARWIDRGLRAQLQSGNLITGQKQVALDIFPDAPKAALTYSNGLPVVPTVPSEMEVLSDKVTAFLDKLDKAPIDGLVADARNAVQQTGKLLASPSLHKGVDGLKDVGPLLDSLKQTSNAANATLTDAQTTVKAANSLLGPDAPLQYDLAQMLRELTNTARSLRTLADFLERNPNALLLGKPLPEKP